MQVGAFVRGCAGVSSPCQVVTVEVHCATGLKRTARGGTLVAVRCVDQATLIADAAAGDEPQPREGGGGGDGAGELKAVEGGERSAPSAVTLEHSRRGEEASCCGVI